MQNRHRILGSFAAGLGCFLSACCKPADVPVALESTTSVAIGTTTVTVTAAAEEPKKDVKIALKPKENAPIGFDFAQDAEGKLLARQLVPAPMLQPSLGVLAKHSSAPSSLKFRLEEKAPEPSEPPMLPITTTAKLLPTPLPDRLPADLAPVALQLPPGPPVPPAPLVRIPAADLSKPIDLPILAKHNSERASLDDPTQEFSTKAVLGSKLPLRENPVGFLKANIPDPSEYSADSLPRQLPAEDPNRSLGNPPPPRK